MLQINNNEYNVLSSEIKYIDLIYNNRKMYSISVLLDIEFNNKKGYISFDVDFFNIKDFKNIENRKYVEVPTDLGSNISMIEIFDTENFIDFIDSEVTLEFGSINNNKIHVTLNINDELITLQYNGLLNIKQ